MPSLLEYSRNPFLSPYIRGCGIGPTVFVRATSHLSPLIAVFFCYMLLVYSFVTHTKSERITSLAPMKQSPAHPAIALITVPLQGRIYITRGQILCHRATKERRKRKEQERGESLVYIHVPAELRYCLSPEISADLPPHNARKAQRTHLPYPTFARPLSVSPCPSESKGIYQCNNERKERKIPALCSAAT